jgi:hypothetical protein
MTWITRLVKWAQGLVKLSTGDKCLHTNVDSYFCNGGLSKKFYCRDCGKDQGSV